MCVDKKIVIISDSVLTGRKIKQEFKRDLSYSKKFKMQFEFLRAI